MLSNVLIGAPEYRSEYRFCPNRRWRFDYAWPDLMIAIEYEGGIWGRGRHIRPIGFNNDCIKYNTATLMGWRVYRITRTMLDDGTARELIGEIFK